MRLPFKEILKRVALGQVVSFLMSFTGVSTTILVNNGASYPLLQSVTSYLFIFIVFGPLFACILYKYRKRKFSNFKFLTKWWKYAVLAIVDLEANFCVVFAYQYTDLLSVQLLNFFTVPCVLVLSFFILKTKFALTHIFGCVIACGGVAFLVGLDADGLSRSDKGANSVLGDIMCLISSALYATSNVLTEWFVKPRDSIQVPQGASECAGSESRADSHSDADVESILEATEEVQPVPREGGAADPAATTGPDEVEPVFSQKGEEERVLSEKGEAMSSFSQSKNGQACVAPGECNEKDTTEGLDTEDADFVPAYIPVIENLAMMSMFALLFSTVQFFAVEWRTFAPKRSLWTSQDWLFQIVFGLTMLLVYICMPTLFVISSAAFANVSLMTSNVYAIIWNVAVFKVYPTKLFFVAYVIIVIGILLFNLTDVIRIPCCTRWNYPCGEPHFNNDEDNEDTLVQPRASDAV